MRCDHRLQKGFEKRSIGPILLQYEQQLQEHMRSHELLLLCAYRAGSLRDPVKSALLNAHDAVLKRHEDDWNYTPTTLTRALAESRTTSLFQPPE